MALLKQYKNYLLILAGLVLLITLSLTIHRHQERQRLAYYQITCGEGIDQSQYISVKKDGDKYQVHGSWREFPGCTIKLFEPQP